MSSHGTQVSRPCQAELACVLPGLAEALGAESWPFTLAELLGALCFPAWWVSGGRAMVDCSDLRGRPKVNHCCGGRVHLETGRAFPLLCSWHGLCPPLL